MEAIDVATAARAEASLHGVLVTRARPAQLRLALDAIAASTVRPSRLVVVDNDPSEAAYLLQATPYREHGVDDADADGTTLVPGA